MRGDKHDERVNQFSVQSTKYSALCILPGTMMHPDRCTSNTRTNGTTVVHHYVSSSRLADEHNNVGMPLHEPRPPCTVVAPAVDICGALRPSAVRRVHSVFERSPYTHTMYYSCIYNAQTHVRRRRKWAMSGQRA